MNPANLTYFSQLLYQRSGLVLSADKAYLIQSRLGPIARKWKSANLDDLIQRLRDRKEETLIGEIVEAMTTNESFFFRDQKPFDQFRQYILPLLLKNRASQKSIRIWSAACSTGQEAYSLAMILSEVEIQWRGWKVDIIGTDLSNEVLTKAKMGCYSQFEVQRGLPVTLLVKYFKQTAQGWQIDQKIRNMVQFKAFNLLNDPSSLGKFDLVFCRNVLIYFDQATKTKVLANISRLMPDDGFLVLGGAETILGLGNNFGGIDGQRGLYAPLRKGQAAPITPTKIAGAN